MAPRPSPTARRRRLAAALRQMREARQLSCADAGKAAGWSESKISRIETGRVGVRQPDLERLLDLYEVSGEARTAMLALGRQATHRGWWHSYADALPVWFEDYVGLEDGAKSLFTYQNQLVHGLMQTEEYAATVIRAARPAASADEVERQLAARATRQALLTAANPLQVWAVLDEAVLRRQVGGSAVMRAQLTRILEVAALPNVTLQVLPFDTGAHASMGTSFELLQFPEAGDTSIVYIEDHTSSQYLETTADIERYTLVFDHLRASALSPQRSAEFISQVAGSMT
ncbi:MAG TPA: helix-turn-helix transcriptional regulator [Streptosporangiaceae bacterium]|nr:helix-turn-helix transcriptional regulator [Streptosporangiaceae bacterium]